MLHFELEFAMLNTLILSGGSGSQLWPASREGHPKPFIKLADGETLIQKTYERARALGGNILTVTNRDYYFISRDEQERIGISGDFLLEPCGRNTAPAIALAAHQVVQAQGPDTVMLVLPADHLIEDLAGFAAAVGQARQLAGEGYLVTFGIVPTAPETGFGYIEQGEALGEGSLAGKRVARFVEKPDLATAQSYLQSGNYLWNSGMFCFKAGLFLEELQKHAPEVAQALAQCWQAMQPLANPAVAEIPEAPFKTVPDISIDYAVMERSDKVAVIPGNFGWSDIGSWNAIRDLVTPDADNNRAVGETIFIDSRNTFVQSEDRLVATVGIDNLMIIDTADALLVAHPDKAQDVKKSLPASKKRTMTVPNYIAPSAGPGAPTPY